MWHFMKNSLNVHNSHKCAITVAYICISGKILDKIRESSVKAGQNPPLARALQVCYNKEKGR